jgi:hypothetical protein
MAWETAFAIAAAVPTMPISPTPLTPSGFISSSLLFDEDHVDCVNIRIRRHIRRNSESAGSQYQEIPRRIALWPG